MSLVNNVYSENTDKPKPRTTYFHLFQIISDGKNTINSNLLPKG